MASAGGKVAAVGIGLSVTAGLAYLLLRKPTCPEGTVWDEVQRRCIPAISFGTADGYVTDDAGNPVIGATLQMDSITVRTNIYGYYLQANLDAGTYTAKVSATGYVSKTVPIVIVAGEITTTSIEMQKSGDGNGDTHECPDGMVYDSNLKRCVCPDGMTWQTDKCACPDGQVWNDVKKACECPPNYYWDGFQGRCLPVVPSIEIIDAPAWDRSRKTFWQCLVCEDDCRWEGFAYICRCYPRNRDMGERKMRLLVTDQFGQPLRTWKGLTVYFPGKDSDWPRDDYDHNQIIFGVHGPGMAGERHCYVAVGRDSKVYLPTTNEWGETEFYFLINHKSRKDVSIPFEIAAYEAGVVVLRGALVIEGWNPHKCGRECCQLWHVEYEWTKEALVAYWNDDTWNWIGAIGLELY